MANPKYIKVTVLIESDEKLTTFEFPKVTTVEWASKYGEISDIDWIGMKFKKPPRLEAAIMTVEPLPDENGITHTIKHEDKEKN